MILSALATLREAQLMRCTCQRELWRRPICKSLSLLPVAPASLVTRREPHPKLDMLIKADFLMDLKDWFKSCFSKTANSSQDVCAGISNSQCEASISYLEVPESNSNGCESCTCLFFLLLSNDQYVPQTTRERPTIPPTTPPAIAPVLL